MSGRIAHSNSESIHQINTTQKETQVTQMSHPNSGSSQSTLKRHNEATDDSSEGIIRRLFLAPFRFLYRLYSYFFGAKVQNDNINNSEISKRDITTIIDEIGDNKDLLSHLHIALVDKLTSNYPNLSHVNRMIMLTTLELNEIEKNEEIEGREALLSIAAFHLKQSLSPLVLAYILPPQEEIRCNELPEAATKMHIPEKGLSQVAKTFSNQNISYVPQLPFNPSEVSMDFLIDFLLETNES